MYKRIKNQIEFKLNGIKMVKRENERDTHTHKLLMGEDWVSVMSSIIGNTRVQGEYTHRKKQMKEEQRKKRIRKITILLFHCDVMFM